MLLVIMQVVEKVSPEAIAALILAVTAILGAPIIQIVKETLGLSGKLAVVTASVVSLLLSALVAFLNGAFAGFDFSLQSIGALAAVIYSVANLYYKLIMTGKADAKPEAPGE